MEQWAAISIIVIMGVFLIVQLIIMHSFGVYTRLLTKAHKDNLDVRLNLATMKSDEAVLAALHHRRHDDPPLTEEKEA